MGIKSKCILHAISICMCGVLLSGCTHKTKMYEPSTEHKQVYGLRDADTTELFWGKASLDLPLIKYEDVRSGEFDGCWILIDGILAEMSLEDKEKTAGFGDLKILFELHDGNYHQEDFSWMYDVDFPRFDDFTEKGKVKDIVRLCAKVKNHALSKHDVYGLAATGERAKINLDDVIIETETEWIPPETTKNEDDYLITEKPLTGNPLLDADEHTGSVKSGTGAFLGVYRYISIPKADFDSVSEEQYGEFCDYVMSLSDSTNWYTINFEDGTAILYAGCFAYSGILGHQDGEGSVSDAIGYITYENGHYEYEDASSVD